MIGKEGEVTSSLSTRTFTSGHHPWNGSADLYDKNSFMSKNSLTKYHTLGQETR